MSFFVNAPQEEAFRLVMDYFAGRHMKVLMSKSPSYARAEFGSLISGSLGDAKGEVEINIVKRNGGSYINLNFDFSKGYIAVFLSTGIGALMVFIGYGILGIDLQVRLLTILAIVAMVGGGVGYDYSLTRRRFIEEFNMFIQSLTPKKG
jgi:hypothetical protein